MYSHVTLCSVFNHLAGRDIFRMLAAADTTDHATLLNTKDLHATTW
jgi:hypothetical protein